MEDSCMLLANKTDVTLTKKKTMAVIGGKQNIKMAITSLLTQYQKA